MADEESQNYVDKIRDPSTSRLTLVGQALRVIFVRQARLALVPSGFTVRAGGQARLALVGQARLALVGQARQTNVELVERGKSAEAGRGVLIKEGTDRNERTKRS